MNRYPDFLAISVESATRGPMLTQESTNVEALRQQCIKIRLLATEALNGAIKRRDVVLTEVRHEEQRLASLKAERATAEESLSLIHDEVERLMSELQLVGAELTSLPADIAPTPATPTMPVTPSAAESLEAVEDEMERLTHELEMLGAELTPQAAWTGSDAPGYATAGHATPDWSRPPARISLTGSQ
jgi:chromosome segregation ATPase